MIKNLLSKNKSIATIDCNNINKGYVISSFNNPTDGKCIIQICKRDSGILTLSPTHKQNFLVPGDGTLKTIPLCFGNGFYTLKALQQSSENRYDTVLSFHKCITITNPLSPYLYSNTYCEYTDDSLCIKKAKELRGNKTNDIEIITTMYRWIIDNLEYDYELAIKVSTTDMSWWLPNPDKAIQKGKGICWEYASLFAAMLRSQGIPCKICVGHYGSIYHAWNEFYSRASGSIVGIPIKANEWTRIDVTYLDSKKESDQIVKAIQDDSNYTIEYLG